MDFFKGFFGDEDKDKKASPAPGARPVLRVVGASHPPLNAPLGTSPQQQSQAQAQQALPSPTLGSRLRVVVEIKYVPFVCILRCYSLVC